MLKKRKNHQHLMKKWSASHQNFLLMRFFTACFFLKANSLYICIFFIKPCDLTCYILLPF